MSVSTIITAKTAKGAPIECFLTRERADLWAATEGENFPGWQLEIVTTRSTTVRAVLASDPNMEIAA